MKALFIFLAMSAVFVIFLGFITCSDDKSTSPDDEDIFEIHEWGVLVGCVEDTAYYLTSRPEISSMIREPVIYVHSSKKTPFTATVTFNVGAPTDTYPEADVTGNVVQWENVDFCNELASRKRLVDSDFVPLESIIETLNDVDADCLEFGGETARFLFYEGGISYETRVMPSHGPLEQQVTIKNYGTYPVYNVNFVTAVPGDAPPPIVMAGRIAQLNPGQQVTLDLESGFPIVLQADLITQGFTPSEASAFEELWSISFFELYESEYAANLFYRISQAEYNELVTLEVEPAPTEVVRSLYVLVHQFY
jgi:hypothetical protein